jgi:hypothetical protein
MHSIEPTVYDTTVTIKYSASYKSTLLRLLSKKSIPIYL